MFIKTEQFIFGGNYSKYKNREKSSFAKNNYGRFLIFQTIKLFYVSVKSDAHCAKLAVQTNFPNIGKTNIFRPVMKSTFTWPMPYKSIPVLVIT